MVVMLKRLLMPGKSTSMLILLYMSGTWEKKPLTMSGVREVERPQPKSLCEGPSVTVVTTGDPRADRGRAGALLHPTPGTMSSRTLGKPAEMSKPPGTTDAYDLPQGQWIDGGKWRDGRGHHYDQGGRWDPGYVIKATPERFLEMSGYVDPDASFMHTIR